MVKGEKKLIEKFLELMEGETFYPPVHNVSIWAAGAGGFSSEPEKYYEIPINFNLIVTVKGDEGVVLMPESQFNKMSEDVFTRYWGDDKTLEKRKKQFDGLIGEIDDIYNKLTPAYVKETEMTTLIEDVRNITNASRNMNFSGWCANQFDKNICLRYINRLNIGISKERLEEIWGRASEPSHLSFDKTRFEKVLRLLQQDKSWMEIAGKCQYYFCNYNGLAGVEESVELLKEEYGNFDSSEKIEKALADLRHEKQKKKSSHKEWTKTLSDEEKKLADYIQEMMLIKDARKDPMSQALSVAHRIVQKMFEQVGVSKEYITYYAYEEILEGLDYLAKEKSNIIKRKQGFTILMTKDGELKMEYGGFEETKSLMEQIYLQQERSAVEEGLVKGNTGCPGSFEGTVRVVRDPSKAGDFKKGDILVTGMTRPEFVPLMKKAGAIVTDEGGITCHAAIVAREMNKPCIIGTKIATKVLKDGDEVEVDADKGIVKILEK